MATTPDNIYQSIDETVSCEVNQLPSPLRYGGRFLCDRAGAGWVDACYWDLYPRRPVTCWNNWATGRGFARF